MALIKKTLKAIWALIIGHFTIFKHSFKKRVTEEYPEVKPVLNERFRGKHDYDIDKCIFCGICVKVCPAGAISLSKEEQTYSIDLNKCIFCGNCMYYCPKKAIILSSDFELASANKSDLILNFTKSDKLEGENS